MNAGAFIEQAAGQIVDKNDPNKRHYTSYELYAILHTPEFLAKTTFYRQGQVVTDEFLEQMKAMGWEDPRTPSPQQSNIDEDRAMILFHCSILQGA